MNQRGSGGEAPFSLPCSPHGLQLAARSQMKKRTSKLKTAKQQTGRCPETLLSPPYRGGCGGFRHLSSSSSSSSYPCSLRDLHYTKKPVVAKRHISIYVRVCVVVVVGGCFYMPRIEVQSFAANLKQKEI